MNDQLMNNDDESGQVKFELYRRQKEIKEVAGILQQLSSSGKSEQMEWLQDNEDFVTEMAENFVDDSLFKLDGVKLDNETVQLSVEVMAQLKKTLGLFQNIVSGESDLEA